ncbi:hypothetical protein [Oryza sativa Japonica Group]|uniref:Uncharacterized protein n=1 Tax=Oryza sativa subsp. japonica TaxID=39947 RepID=Q656H3_ORYSJ|nr:hypothetical protein [Oryza sativa Japonica Group]
MVVLEPGGASSSLLHSNVLQLARYEPLKQAMRPRGPRGHRRCHGGWVREARGRGLAGMAPRLMLFFLLLMEVPWHAPRERHPTTPALAATPLSTGIHMHGTLSMPDHACTRNCCTDPR